MAVQPVTSIVTSGFLVDQSRSVTMNVMNAEMHIEGTAHDIARIVIACKQKLGEIEANQLDPGKMYCVHVLAPKEDEQ